MLRLITRCGAPSPVGGMKRLATQDATDDTIISQAKWIGSPPSLAASPATMVPIRMARKVPPSTSALPEVNSGAFEVVGQDAVLDRSEQRSDRPVHADGNEQQRDRVEGKAGDRKRGNADLDEFQTLRHQSLVETVCEFAADTGKEEERSDQRGAGKRDQRLGVAAGDVEQNEKDQRGLEEVVAEGGEELAPEQGRETSRRHQGRRHGSPAVPSAEFILDGRASLGDVNSRDNGKPTQVDGMMAASNSATESGGYGAGYSAMTRPLAVSSWYWPIKS